VGFTTELETEEEAGCLKQREEKLANRYFVFDGCRN